MPTVSHIPPGWVLLMSALVLFVLYQAAMWWIGRKLRTHEKKRERLLPIYTTAEHLVDLFGKDLVGTYVTTYDYGTCRGGHFQITEISPDPAAPEIVFNIAHPDFEEIGVFDHENVYYE